MDGEWLRWVVGIAFLGFAAWALIPDGSTRRPEVIEKTFMGIFWTTTAAFFLIEMGDKTQVATAMMAARFQTILPGAGGIDPGDDAGQRPGGAAGRGRGASAAAGLDPGGGRRRVRRDRSLDLGVRLGSLPYGRRTGLSDMVGSLAFHRGQSTG